MKSKRKHIGFKVPKDYFETFEDSLFSKLENSNSNNKTGFSVPDNYFENVEDAILNKIEAEDSIPVISLFNKKTLLFVASIAACIVLVFSIFKNNDVSVNDIATTEIENYLETNQIISETELLSLLDNEDINQLIKETNTIANQQIEDYLLDNLDDTSLLTE